MGKKSSSFSYQSFGLIISSDVEIHELTNGSGIPDVQIMISDLHKEWKAVKSEARNFYIERELTIFEIREVGIFKVINGHTIFYTPFPKTEKRQLKLYLLGTCMGAILLQRKVLPLHGSAVLINGEAYAVVGESGAGKSTLARALMKRGYPLISDDVIAVRFREGKPFISSAYAQQKLWQESLDLFNMDSNQYESIMARETKFNVPVGRSFYEGEVELAGIFELSKAEVLSATIKPIKGIQKLPLLFQHTYRRSFIGRMGLTEWHFGQSAKLADQLPVYKIIRPVHINTAEQLADSIIQLSQKERTNYAKAK